MSAHRKIEWSLFILGLVGTGVSFWFVATTVQTILFAVGMIFAGLHVFHFYDGHKSNRIVVTTSLALVAYTGYLAFTNMQYVISTYAAVSGLVMSILLSILSLRLRRDFHKV